MYGDKRQPVTLPGIRPNGCWEFIQWEFNNIIVNLDKDKSLSYRNTNLKLDNESFSLTILNFQSSNSGLYKFTLDFTQNYEESLYQLCVLGELRKVFIYFMHARMYLYCILSVCTCMSVCACILQVYYI